LSVEESAIFSACTLKAPVVFLSLSVEPNFISAAFTEKVPAVLPSLSCEVRAIFSVRMLTRLSAA
jgi:hypothetical protein